MKEISPDTLFCVFCNGEQEPEAPYCPSCNEYKGITTWEKIQREYPFLVKEIQGE